MALRLRRGTDTERQLITPIQGELIYTTDTKQVYVGDGTTVGGVPVDKEILLSLGDLTNVEDAVPDNGDVLSWNSGLDAWNPTTFTINSLDDVDTATDLPVDESVLAWDAAQGAWVTTDLDLLLNSLSVSEMSDVDTITTPPSPGNVLTWDQIESAWVTTPSSSILNANSINQLVDVDTLSTEPDDGSLLVWSNLTTAWRVQSVADALGTLTLNSLGDTDVPFPEHNDVLTWDSSLETWVPRENDSEGIVEGGNYRLNVIGDDSSTLVNFATGEHFGFFDGQFYGDLQGNVFADDSSLLVDWLTRTFFGNVQTGSITADNSYIGFETNETILPGNSLEMRAISQDAPSFIRLSNQSTDPGVVEDGSVRFSRIDDLGVVNSSSTITSTTTELIFARRPTTGGVGPLSHIAALTQDGHFVIGGIVGTEKLTVNGNTNVSGFVQFGSFTTTERDALTAQNGMVLYNTTTNRFQGYQAGAWINLDDGTAA